MNLKFLCMILTISLFVGETSYAKSKKRKKLTKSKSSLNKSIKKISKKKKLRFIKAKVIVYEGETLADILRRFVKDDAVIFRDEKMVDMTIKNNPQVENWRELKTGQVLYVYIDPKFIDAQKVAKFRKKVKKVTKKIKKKIVRRKVKNKVKKYSAFYMASTGQFQQKNSSLAEIDFKQDSPVTLGAMYTHFPKRGNYTISSSAYFSYLLAATTNTEDNNVDLPLEIGLNSYYQHPILNRSFYLYGGFDYEKFNTFNLEGVEEKNEISFDENQLLFLTAGASKTFSLFNTKLLFKGSLSHSIYSSRDSGYSGDDGSESYSGYKLMGFLMGKVNKDFFLSSLFKYHMLSGPSEVSILRIGVGCGYLF